MKTEKPQTSGNERSYRGSGSVTNYQWPPLWQYLPREWQCSPDIHEFHPRVSLIPNTNTTPFLLAEMECFMLDVSNILCYSYSHSYCQMVKISTRKVSNLIKPIFEVKSHGFCIWMIKFPFKFGIKYEYWL